VDFLDRIGLEHRVVQAGMGAPAAEAVARLTRAAAS
jgi:hypothetical protein